MLFSFYSVFWIEVICPVSVTGIAKVTLSICYFVLYRFALHLIIQTSFFTGQPEGFHLFEVKYKDAYVFGIPSTLTCTNTLLEEAETNNVFKRERILSVILLCK